MVQNNEINVANAKIVMMKIIDGERKMPLEIAEDLGIAGKQLGNEELRDKVNEVMSQNGKILEKIIKTGNDGPIKALVGKVMKATNRKGDPQKIKVLIEEVIDEIR